MSIHATIEKKKEAENYTIEILYAKKIKFKQVNVNVNSICENNFTLQISVSFLSFNICENIHNQRRV